MYHYVAFSIGPHCFCTVYMLGPLRWKMVHLLICCIGGPYYAPLLSAPHARARMAGVQGYGPSERPDRRQLAIAETAAPQS